MIILAGLGLLGSRISGESRTEGGGFCYDEGHHGDRAAKSDSVWARCQAKPLSVIDDF